MMCDELVSLMGESIWDLSWDELAVIGDVPSCIGEHSAPRRLKLHELVLDLPLGSPERAQFTSLWAFAGNITIDRCDWCGEWRSIARVAARR